MHDSVTPGPDEETLRGEATGLSAFRGSLVEDAESTEAGMLTPYLLAKRPGAAAGGVLLAASDDPFEGSRTEQVVITAVREDGHVVGRGSGQLNDPTQSAIARIAVTAAEGPMFTTEQMGAWFDAARSR